LRFLLALLFAALISPAAAEPCDFNCKIRISFCYVEKGQTKCGHDDKLPEQTGLCAIMQMGAIGEWIVKNPGKMFKSAECVQPDDAEL
jgi:hypothetical protein